MQPLALSFAPSCASCRRCRFPCALAPLIHTQRRWVYHYPFFANNFCLAYHLAVGLREAHRRHDIGQRIRRYDWSVVVPPFDWRRDVDFFVGTQESIDQCENDGHRVESVLFTRYRPYCIFLNKARLGGHPPPRTLSQLIEILRQMRPADILFITDVVPTAKLFHDHVAAKLGVKGLEVRRYTQRDLGDLHDPRQFKVYLFGGPRTALFRRNREKYLSLEVKDTVFRPVPTFMVFRYNDDVAHAEVKLYADAVTGYYATLYRRIMARGGASWWTSDIIDDYNRIAESERDRSPFDSATRRPLKTYDDIIDRHHDRTVRLPRTVKTTMKIAPLSPFDVLDRRLDQVLRYHQAAARADQITHFTEPTVLETAAKNREFRLRMYDVRTMNDPNEGRALDKFLRAIPPIEGRTRAVAGTDVAHALGVFGAADPGTFPCVFISAFTKKNDELDIWIAYGDSGRGCAFVLPFRGLGVQDQESFRAICYSDEDKWRFAFLIGEPIVDALDMLYPRGNIDRHVLQAHQTVIGRIRARLATLQHLYKDLHYEYEREVRMTATMDLKKDHRRILEDVEANRVYVEGLRVEGTAGLSVLLGPRYADRERARTMLTHAFSRTWRSCPDVKLSIIEFR